MSCLRKKCICKTCRPRLEEIKASPKKMKEILLKNARYSYALGALWKRVAKDWEKQATDIK